MFDPPGTAAPMPENGTISGRQRRGPFRASGTIFWQPAGSGEEISGKWYHRCHLKMVPYFGSGGARRGISSPKFGEEFDLGDALAYLDNESSPDA